MRALLIAAALAAATPAAANTFVIDRCHVRLEPASPADQKTRKASIEARFPGATVELDYTGTLVERLGFAKPLASKTPADRAATAHAFVEANRDLLNIDPADKLDFDEKPVSRRGEMRYTLDARFEHRGIDRLLGFLIDQTGAITSVLNAHPVPDFPMCDAPSLRADDPKLVAHVVGQTIAVQLPGGKRENRKIAKAEGISPQLKLVIRREGGPHEWIRGYSVTVSELGQAFFVDGETGDVIERP